MRTHFDNVGFDVPTRDHLTALIRRTAREGRPIEAPHGMYFRWTPGAGIELWAGIDPQRELTAFNPHFAGSGRMRVRVERLDRDRQAPLTGSVHGVVAGTDGSVPLSIDVPDFDVLTAPGDNVSTFQVAAFAHEVHVFEDEQAFQASGAGRPAQTLERVQDEDEVERSDALIAGVAAEVDTRENPVTGARFHWMLVRTVGGTVDVVADLEVISGPPAPGVIVYGEFWLSGRVIEPDDAVPMVAGSQSATD
jgi:hypothetical protein